MSIDGRWLLADSNNLEGYLKAIGAADGAIEKARLMEVPGEGGGKAEFSLNGDKLTAKLLNKDNVVFQEQTVTLGVESAGKSMDGRDVKCTLTKNGNVFTRDESGPGYTAQWVRTIEGDSMTVVMTSGGVTCTRKFKRA